MSFVTQLKQKIEDFERVLFEIVEMIDDKIDQKPEEKSFLKALKEKIEKERPE